MTAHAVRQPRTRKCNDRRSGNEKVLGEDARLIAHQEGVSVSCAVA